MASLFASLKQLGSSLVSKAEVLPFEVQETHVLSDDGARTWTLQDGRLKVCHALVALPWLTCRCCSHTALCRPAVSASRSSASSLRRRRQTGCVHDEFVLKMAVN